MMDLEFETIESFYKDISFVEFLYKLFNFFELLFIDLLPPFQSSYIYQSYMIHGLIATIDLVPFLL